MTAYDYDRPFIDHASMRRFDAIDAEAKKYGKTVLAVELSNSEYGQRFLKFGRANNMKAPPSSGRIFSGWLVVRNLGTTTQYETWIPAAAFDDCYSEQRQNPREDRTRKAAAALANPDVIALIDVEKLVVSTVFADIAQDAMQHLLSQGDTGFAQRALALVAGTPHEAALFQWFQTRTGIKLARSGDRLRIESRDAAPDERASLSAEMSNVAGGRRGKLNQAKPASQKRSAPPATQGQDLMDSRLMLPGSFGSGKRR